MTNWNEEAYSFRNFLIKNKVPFSEVVSFSGSKFTLSDGKKMNFLYKDKKKYIFLSSKIKSEAKKNVNIDGIKVIDDSFLKVDPCRIYSNKNAISGYYYDINSAYATLNSLFVGNELTEMLLKEKEKGININKAIGYAYLGTKYHYEYYGIGNLQLVKTEQNPLRNLFLLLRNICISLIRKICDFYQRCVIAYYIDAVIFKEKTNFQNKINDFLLESVCDLDKKITKKYNIYISDFLNKKVFIENLLNMKITFKEKFIESLIWEEINGVRTLTFYRDGKKTTYKQTMKNIF